MAALPLWSSTSFANIVIVTVTLSDRVAIHNGRKLCLAIVSVLVLGTKQPGKKKGACIKNGIQVRA